MRASDFFGSHLGQAERVEQLQLTPSPQQTMPNSWHVVSQVAVQLHGRLDDGGLPGVGGGIGTGSASRAMGRDASIVMPQMPLALTPRFIYGTNPSHSDTHARARHHQTRGRAMM